MTELFGEFLGTFILILLGNGVVANVSLKNTYSNGGGWIVITAGWAMAVFIAVFITADISGAHLNPAVTVGLAAAGLFEWGKVIPFIIAQTAGAMAGAALVYLFFLNHFNITETAGVKKACFCTAPAIRHFKSNFLSEVVGTFVLVFAVLMITLPELNYKAVSGSEKVGMGALGALPVALVVFSIGMSLGGTTGYAINPARDFGPRLTHWVLPIKNNKDNTDWQYSWIPILGPVTGALIAAGVYVFVLNII